VIRARKPAEAVPDRVPPADLPVKKTALKAQAEAGGTSGFAGCHLSSGFDTEYP